MQTLKAVALTSALLAATTFGAFAQTSTGSNSMSKSNTDMGATAKHQTMKKSTMKKATSHKMASKSARGKNAGKNCTQQGGKKASGHAQKC